MMSEVDWKDHLELIDCFESVFQNAYLSDVELMVCTGEKMSDGQDKKKLIPAHSFMLSLRSTYFAELLEKKQPNLCGGKKWIAIDGVLEDAFMPILKFLYTEDTSSIDETNIVGVYEGAKKFALNHLANKCVELAKLKANKVQPELIDLTTNTLTNYKNVLALLKVAKNFDDPLMLESCWFFIDLNIGTVLDKAIEEKEISKEFLEEVLSRDTIIADEDELFECLDKWAYLQCQADGIASPNGKQKRAKMGKLLYKIRIPTIAPKDFMAAIVPTKVLTYDEIVDVLMHYVNKEHEQPFDEKPRKPRQPKVLIDKSEAYGTIRELQLEVIAIQDQLNHVI